MQEPPRAAVLGLGALARLTRAQYSATSTSWPTQKRNLKAADQRAGLGPPELAPKCHESAQRAIMALAQHLCAQPAIGRDADTISLTVTVTVARHRGYGPVTGLTARDRRWCHAGRFRL